MILYIRQPWFLIHSVLGEVLAMPSQTRCPLHSPCMQPDYHLAHAARKDFSLYAHMSHTAHATHLCLPPTTSLSSPPPYLHHLPILTTSLLHNEDLRVRKVTAERHPVLLGMANTSPRTECIRKQGCRIYRITGKITEPGVQSCQT